VIQLHTFGEALIRVGEKDVRPSAPVLFAALLYLCVERGRRVPRTALQELLFPGSDERSGAHSLRQLLYKLRQLGAPLEVDAMSVLLPNGAVKAHGADGRAAGNGSAREVLPGYAPGFSEPFGNWLERFRAHHAAAARAELLSELKASRDSGDIARTSQIASGLLALDPLNEEATLALAESMALGGQKVEAVRMLEEYANEVGSTSPDLRLPADLLRRRITDRLVPRERPVVPLIGREMELSELLSHFNRATGSQATVSVIWGEPGIGKTRLVEEFQCHVALRSAIVEATHCRAQEVGPPMGAILDLVPRLLLARGALGISPESMSDLRRLTGDGDSAPLPGPPQVIAGRIRVALEELVHSISVEYPLVLVLEDAHWLDDISLSLLHTLSDKRWRLHVVLTQRTRPRTSPNGRLTQHWFARQLEPLSAESSLRLLAKIADSPGDLAPDLATQCLALANGNALFLCTLAEHLRNNGVVPPQESSLSDLLRQRFRCVGSSALLLLRVIAAFGPHGTHGRVMRAIGFAGSDGLLALQELAERGLITQDGPGLKCAHDLLSQLVLEDTPAAVRAAVMERVAHALEEEGLQHQQPHLLWDCANYWREALNPTREANALKQCATFASNIGQPRFALEALTRAQALVPQAELPHLLEDSIRAADDAVDSDAVMDGIAKLRAIKSPVAESPRLGIADLAEVNNWRRKLIPVWDHRDKLRFCAMDPDTPTADRLRAARVFVLEAEQALDREAAETLFSTLNTDLEFSHGTADWLYFQLAYHGAIGDLRMGRDLATTFLNTHSDTHFRATGLAHNQAAVVLLRAGMLTRAGQIWDQAIADAKRLELSASVLSNYYHHRCTLSLYAGAIAEAHALHNAAREIFANETLAPPGQIANAIELAIVNRRPEEARQQFAALSEHYRQLLTPNRERLMLGYELLIHYLERNTLQLHELLNRGSSLYERGRTYSEGDYLPVGIAAALSLLGRAADGQRLLWDYCLNWRRDFYALPPFLRSIALDAGIDIPVEAC
jgi:DNA-binding SARP family transcriptional activator